MTEERIKEIVTKEWSDDMDIEDLIRTIAAEARKECESEIGDLQLEKSQAEARAEYLEGRLSDALAEARKAGIEEMRDGAIDICYDSGVALEKIDQVEKRINNKAEWLKEQ